MKAKKKSPKSLKKKIVLPHRKALISRATKETDIRIEIDLDGDGTSKIRTGLHFFDHMLDQVARHSGISLSIATKGDLHIDEHHTIEDTALALGEALRKALGDKRGIGRYGWDQIKDGDTELTSSGQGAVILPMDEALATCAIDFSGRSVFVFEGVFKREKVGDFPTELLKHFWESLCRTAGLNMHLTLRGENEHHMIEASFKAFARALKQAVRLEGTALPSTKGVL